MAQTSITVTKFDAFKARAEVRSELRCSKITGLFAIKLKTGISWRLRYTSPVDGKRKTATLPGGGQKPMQAAEIALRWRLDIDNGIDPVTQKAAEKAAQRQEDAARQYLNTGRYFEEIYTPYQLAYRRSGKQTLAIIRHNFSDWFCRDMDKLNDTDVVAWFNKRREQGIGRATLRRALTSIKAMLAHASQARDNQPPLLARNPLLGVSLPKPTVEEEEQEEAAKRDVEKTRNALSSEVKEQIKQGLLKFDREARDKRHRSLAKSKNQHLPSLDQAAFGHWFVPFVWISWLTGMRPGDVRVLRWESLHHNPFNQSTSLVFVPSKTKDKHGDGEDPIRVNFPVDGRLLQVLTQWRDQQGSPASGYMFPSERTGGPIERKAYQTHWNRVKTLGGVPESLQFYCFRHNYISSRIMEGARELEVAREVGHRTAEMIARNYFHIPSGTRSTASGFSDNVLQEAQG